MNVQANFILEGSKKYSMVISRFDSIDVVKKLFCSNIDSSLAPENVKLSTKGTELLGKKTLADYSFLENQDIYVTVENYGATRIPFLSDLQSVQNLKSDDEDDAS